MLAAGAFLVAATGCSGSNTGTVVPDSGGTSPDDGTTGEVTASAASDTRFQSLWLDTAALFHRADDLLDESEPPPQSAAEANDQLGLSDESDLWFADYSANENGDAERLCLVSRDGTYVTFDWTHEFDILLGDGDCSYDEQAAEVAATMIPAAWLKGAALMGDVRVDAIVGKPSLEDRLSSEGSPGATPLPTETPGLAAAPAGEALARDARTLGAALASYFTAKGRYPEVAAPGLVRRVGVELSPGTVVRAYRVKPDSFQVCVTNRSAGAFATYDAELGDIASGAGNPVDLLDALCGIAPTG